MFKKVSDWQQAPLNLFHKRAGFYSKMKGASIETELVIINSAFLRLDKFSRQFKYMQLNMSENNKFICHCGDWRFKNAFFIVDDIREKVCRDLPEYGEVDGKKYCVLHYPSKAKAEDFDLIYQERIKEDNWDFMMVYFPSRILIDSFDFHNDADFRYATFAEYIAFKYCKFYGRFEFFDSKFLEDALFLYSEFIGAIHFNSVDFQGGGDFSGVTFHEKSHISFEQTKFKACSFDEVKFYCDARFSKAIFKSSANFENAVFLQKLTLKK